MKKIILVLSLFGIISCENQIGEEKKIDVCDNVIMLDNFNNTGVNLRIDPVKLTRTSGIIDEYAVESVMPDGVILRGVIRLETLPSGYKTVSLYRLDNFFADEIFIGSYTIDSRIIVRKVNVGNDPFSGFTSEPIPPHILDQFKDKLPNRRLPEEKYWACVVREYKKMKEAYQDRPLDDIACDVVPAVCKALAFVAAAYECRN